MTRNELFVGFLFFILLGRSAFAQPDSASVSHYRNGFTLSDYLGSMLIADNGAAAPLFTASIIDVSISNRFCIKELTNAHLGAVFRFRHNSFLLSFHHLGYNRFGELSADVGYARSFGRHFAAGARFYYLMTHAEGYPAAHSVTFDLSLRATIGKRFGLGFACYNPAGLKYGIVGNSRLPMVFCVDLQYFLGQNLLLHAQVKQELKSRIALRLGSAVKLKKIYLNIAIGFPEPVVQVDIDVNVKRLMFGANCQYRPAIGPIMGAGFRILI